MECFFQRLEGYIPVQPTAVMKDIIVKIMVEVLSILGIVTKEIGQGKLSMPFRIDLSIFTDRSLCREVSQETGWMEGH